MKLRPHQLEKSTSLLEVLQSYKIAYLFGEVRSGKTLTALNTAELFGAKKLLIVTKKKAIDSIKSDYDNFGFTYNLVVINYESLHKITDKDFDLIIYDEAHSLSAYPKPSKCTKIAKKQFYNIPCILMSGTPSPESYSQYYHQFYVSKFSPFKDYTTFYKWAKEFVNVKEMKLPTHTIKDYSGAIVEEVDKVIEPYVVKMTQKDAGFDVNIKEHYLKVETPVGLQKLCNKLLKDRVIQGSKGYILGDSPAKLQSKYHQLMNGSCIIEDEQGQTFDFIFDDYKAKFILERFKDFKIAIMYYYQNELKILQDVLKDSLTTDLDEFNSTNKWLAIQQNTTEGLNLSKADALVYYNLGFSGKNFIQSRDRLTVKDRKSNDVYFICESGGMTKKILKAVQEKKDFNSKLFLKEFQK